MMKRSLSPLLSSLLFLLLVNCPAVTRAQEQCTNATRGSDSGGSCTFDRDWCGWRNMEDNDRDWRRASSGGSDYLSLSMRWTSAGKQGKLIGPLLCATGSQLHSFRFRYFLEKTENCRLSAYLVVSGTGFGSSSSSSSSSHLLWSSTRGSASRFLSVDSLNFRCSHSNFQIMLVGEKLSNRYQSCGTDFNEIGVKDVVYSTTRTSVDGTANDMDMCPAAPSPSPITMMMTTSAMKTTMMEITSAGGGGGDSVGDTTVKPGPLNATNTTSTGKEEESGGLGGGAVAGIVIVVILLIIIAVIVIILVVRRRKTGSWRWKGSLPTVVKIRRSVTHRTHYMLGGQRTPEIATHHPHHHRPQQQEPKPDVTTEPSAPPPSPPTAPPPPSSPLYTNLAPNPTATTTTTTTEFSSASHPHEYANCDAQFTVSSTEGGERRKEGKKEKEEKERENQEESQPYNVLGQSSDHHHKLGGHSATSSAAATGGGITARGDAVVAAAAFDGGGDGGGGGCSGNSDTYNHLGDDRKEKRRRGQPWQTPTTTGDTSGVSPCPKSVGIKGEVTARNLGGGTVEQEEKEGQEEERSREELYANEETYANERAGDLHGNAYANSSSNGEDDLYSLARPVSLGGEEEKEEKEDRQKKEEKDGKKKKEEKEKGAFAESAAADCEYSLAQHVKEEVCDGDGDSDHYYNPVNPGAQQTTPADYHHHHHKDSRQSSSLAPHFLQGRGRKSPPATSAALAAKTADTDSSQNMYSLARHATPTNQMDMNESAQIADVSHGSGDVNNAYAHVTKQRSNPNKPEQEEETSKTGEGDYYNCNYMNVGKCPRNPTTDKDEEWNKVDRYHRLDPTQPRSAEDSGASEEEYYNLGPEVDRYDHLHHLQVGSTSPQKEGPEDGSSVYCNVKGSGHSSPC